MHPITALQSESSLWTRDPEQGVLAERRELGIGFVPYSPLGHGFLTGKIRSIDDLDDDGWLKADPRFTGQNLQRNLAIGDQVEAIANQAGATPAPVALAWLLANGDDIVPIPGTKRVDRLEERRRGRFELTAEQITTLDTLTAAAGDHHNEAQMALLER